MMLSDLSVKRPVFATVVSLLLVTFGIVTFLMLPIRELPDTTSPKISVTTTYDGASAEVVESKITNIIEDQLGGIEGIKAIESSSSHGNSRINIEFTPDRDMDSAANDVREALSRVTWRMPDEAESPVVWKDDGSGESILMITLKSDQMSPIELTDYAQRTLQDRLGLVDGVSSAEIFGIREYVMRVELDPVAMAARQITASDIQLALERDNVELPAGELNSDQRSLQIRVIRDYNTVDDFQRMVVRQDGSSTVYLSDVASIRTDAKDTESLAKANGQNVVTLGIIPLSSANPLNVVKNVKAELEAFRPFLPEGAKLSTTYDASVFIESAINEVYQTLFITVGLVILVLYIFLGNARATLIPAITVPVSLISAFIVIYALGYSINLLTLLALILAIGLVVDDAIVVLENIHRHLEAGTPPLAAAWKGAREVGFAVIATTVVLVMTFVPIVFMSGTIGRLFSEYALTLAGAVVFSSLIALTLSPMLGSRILKLNVKPSRLNQLTERGLSRMEQGYERCLKVFLRHKWAGAGILAGSLALSALIYPLIPQTFTPPEDRGVVFVMVKGPEGASYQSMESSMLDIESRLLPELDNGPLQFMFMQTPGWGGRGNNTGMLIVGMDDWEDRNMSVFQLAAKIRQLTSDIPNVSAFPVMRSSIGGRSQAPIQFVVGGGSFDELVEWSDLLQEKARENPGLTDLDLDFNQNQPQLEVSINKERAQQLGVSAEEIGSTLEIMLGGVTATTFMERGEEYDVYLKAPDNTFHTAEDLASMYVRSHTTGALIRLDNLVTVEEVGKASQLRHYNRNRAITLSASLQDGYSIGEALDYLDQLVVDHLPQEATVDYKGESLDYRTNQSSILMIFGLAMLIVYLVLAAQFESFVHPLVVMLTVPLGLAGALAGLLLAGETLNIYSQLALIMLIGLATKNGILIVEFANQLRDQGLAFEKAVIEAARLRLRPILMTALTTVAGAVPLLLSTGAGAESRFTIGVVVFWGVLISSLLTIFVVPAMYALLARKTTSPEHVSQQLEQQLKEAH
ncbi:efflux RND transporter permease subunit [Endozoicomonas numazuensis]|uniref:Multidrug transporter AcrB n=1 Tax=Endozoicomonas numazuensis TaxID=1137799 RepID=A0A081NF31_9GAMM|nr:efflux RND transporter permease subunit [Endozoicomonas numazuensis]KEQ17054.1 multidrug transporter AcrB [Endozoicomonas numazuensis]